METTTLGRGGPQVSRLGLGLMGMSGIYGPADDVESVATIRAALDAGINLLDTGDFYGMGHNELLLREALRDVDRGSVFIQVKFGGQRDPGGAFVGYDASPAAVKSSLAYTLRRLGTDYVDLYQPARLDPHVPIEDTAGAIAEMIEAGFVRYLGLSEMGADTIRRAHAVHPVTALQIEYSLMSRGIAVQLLPAWVTFRGSDIVPLLGTKRRDRLAEALGALDIGLTAADLAAIEAAVPLDQVAGDRYDSGQMAALDSEKTTP